MSVDWKRLAREVGLFVPNLVLLFKDLLRDPRVPRRAKVALGLGLGYLALPIDPIPDFLPVIGVVDDALVVALILRFVLHTTARDVVTERWRGEPATLERVLRLAGA